MLTPKRVTLFCGHYGSGKTNIAVNFALFLRSLGKEVCIADMDIVNPYFRTKDSEAELRSQGISLISPHYANSNVDLPALPAELYGLFEFRDKFAVLDIGGDDRGAFALGRFAPLIKEENDFDNLFVANFYRPLTQTPEDSLEVLREIELAGKIPFTGIVNNSNLGDETTPETVTSTFEKAEKLSEISGLPLVFTSAKSEIARDLGGENILPLKLQAKYY